MTRSALFGMLLVVISLSAGPVSARCGGHGGGHGAHGGGHRGAGHGFIGHPGHGCQTICASGGYYAAGFDDTWRAYLARVDPTPVPAGADAARDRPGEDDAPSAAEQAAQRRYERRGGE